MEELNTFSFARVERSVYRAGWLGLLVLAVIYYGLYFRHGLNLGGEGGTAAVIAMRLNEGWLPIKDTFLGYNVLWFYPIAWLFKITGPNYLALRWYFFGLCTVTAVLVFFLVRRVSGLGWYAFLIGVITLAVPGMLFRNYMGFLPVLNAFVFLHAFVFRARSGWGQFAWMAGAGVALGVTFLVRVDLGVFFLLLLIGLLVLFPLGVRGAFFVGAGQAMVGACLVAMFLAVTHWPVYVDARQRGFANEWLGQYESIWKMLRHEVETRILGASAFYANSVAYCAAEEMRAGGRGAPFLVAQRVPEIQRIALSKKKAANAKGSGSESKPLPGTLPRKSLRQLMEPIPFSEKAFILALYAPIPIGFLILLVACPAWFLGVLRREEVLRERALVAGVTLGSAFTLFPQYFFFRPDTPHLSEFMVPFVVAMACSSYFAWRMAWAAHARSLRVMLLLFVGLCTAVEAVYLFHALPKESAGTIAARRKRRWEFRGENGVWIFEKKHTAPRLQGLYEAVMKHSTERDWVICYPYSPTINFMTNRRSYLFNLYVDNATASKRFVERSIQEIETYRPAVIVIDNRDINGTEESRFSSWAAPLQMYIAQHYGLVGTYGENSVYARGSEL